MTKLQDSEIKAYADDAEALLKDYEPPHHIWTAIRHVPEDGRREMFAAVTKELARREKKRKEEDAEMKAEIEADRQEVFEKDAYKHEVYHRRKLGDDF